ncbi:YfbR-like 5'-deoxynucleotidase [Shigella flexneri]
MRNVRTECLQHSLQVAMVAMRWQLSKIGNLAVMSTPTYRFLAMYHDASEVLTGNLPTPVKYSIRKSLRSTRLLKKWLAKTGRYRSGRAAGYLCVRNCRACV